jgi:hypothetical protein
MNRISLSIPGGNKNEKQNKGNKTKKSVTKKQCGRLGGAYIITMGVCFNSSIGSVLILANASNDMNPAH